MANPETCRHNLIYKPLNDDGLFCVSCDTPMTEAMVQGKKYEYDIDHAVWVEDKNGSQSLSASSEGGGRTP